MNKISHPLNRRTSIRALFLGFMILGIGCIVWAMFSLWTAYDYSNNATKSSYAIPTAFASELSMLSLSNAAQTQFAKTRDLGYPAQGDDIGSLTIPALDRKLAILEGTGNAELKKGVGHFIQSVLPGESDNCVLSGHRDTVFSQLGDLEIGDQLIVETAAGIFTYEVKGTRIVEADDKTVIVPADHAVLTLTTCYPFNYIGSAPQRYIVSADLLKSERTIK